MKKSEDGSVLPLLSLLMLVVAGAMYLLAYVTAALLHASYAQTAADAAALAGATDGRAAAQQAASANHAQLVSFKTDGGDTIVVAKVGEATKQARARTDGVTYALANG